MFRNRFRFALVSAALLAGSSALAAQENAVPEEKPDVSRNDPGIVVEGRKQEIRNEIKALIQTDGGQLARFESEFCPKVIGFDAEWTPIVERMIRENVVAAGMEVEDTPCRPTAVVIFSFDPQELVQGLRTRMPGLFEGMPPPEIERLTGTARTAYGWRAVDMLSRDGVALPSAGQINGESTRAKIVRNAAPTRLQSNVRFDIVNAYLVLDIERTPGMSLQQIADFATMHLLLDLSDRATASARQDSILHLFDAADPAELSPRMSVFDRRLLSGLYRERTNNIAANRQRGRIAEHIREGEEDD